MRAAIVFFLSLCLFVFVRHGDVYGSRPNIEKAQQTRFSNAAPDLSVIKNPGLSEKKDDFIGVEDDEDITSSRKYLLQATYFVILDYTSVSFCYSDYRKNRLPFCGHLSFSSSYKYILQRVLRL